MREAGVALSSQFGQLPAEFSAGQGGQQGGAGLVLPPLEHDGDGVAARRLLQLLCQRGEVTRLQWRQETHHQQSAGETKVEAAEKLSSRTQIRLLLNKRRRRVCY